MWVVSFQYTYVRQFWKGARGACSSINDLVSMYFYLCTCSGDFTYKRTDSQIYSSKSFLTHNSITYIVSHRLQIHINELSTYVCTYDMCTFTSRFTKLTEQRFLNSHIVAKDFTTTTPALYVVHSRPERLFKGEENKLFS
jgi:hypothetical protein